MIRVGNLLLHPSEKSGIINTQKSHLNDIVNIANTDWVAKTEDI